MCYSVDRRSVEVVVNGIEARKTMRKRKDRHE